MALRRGPLVLARDARLGQGVDAPVELVQNDDGSVAAALSEYSPLRCVVAMDVQLADGTTMPVIDYASAGNCMEKCGEKHGGTSGREWAVLWKKRRCFCETEMRFYKSVCCKGLFARHSAVPRWGRKSFSVSACSICSNRSLRSTPPA